MRALAADEYRALSQALALESEGSYPVGYGPGGPAARVHQRGLLAPIGTCACCGGAVLTVTPLGRTAMRCYELLARAPGIDLGGAA